MFPNCDLHMYYYEHKHKHKHQHPLTTWSRPGRSAGFGSRGLLHATARGRLFVTALATGSRSTASRCKCVCLTLLLPLAIGRS